VTQAHIRDAPGADVPQSLNTDSGCASVLNTYLSREMPWSGDCSMYRYLSVSARKKLRARHSAGTGGRGERKWGKGEGDRAGSDDG
jgi:hypothetical protein